MILDVLIGDPHRWPHLARYAGALSLAYERWLTAHFQRTILLGFIFWLLVVGTMFAGYLVIHRVCLLVSPVAGYIFDVIVIYQAIAARDLQEHVKAVLHPLTSGDIGAARERLAWIVGRDTEKLDQSEISRATIETIAESIVDGIVAPLL
ncbi:MAG TPA: CobD/CbiB family cobalamin biosynthesis protein, partial [Chthoniobacterales bacterium]|nr:CobD/CbiB family cobalamin biosynthesis protein [Chthoniobacterales bacterium]